jgi:DNA polymerase-1
MKKIYLIDGSSMLTTQYHATMPKEYKFAKTAEDKLKGLEKVMKTSQGVYTNGVLGMTKALLKLIKSEQPEYLAVCWDISRDTFRKKMFSEYKSGRKPTHSTLSEQFETMQETLEAMGIPTLKMENYEADDLIGTLAKNYRKEAEVIIITKDQDALQLIDKNTTVWLGIVEKKLQGMLQEMKEKGIETKYCPNGYFPFTEETFEYFYELKPLQLIDLKAISGDKSDGIPGIPGYGDKSVVPLLQLYGTIEEVFNRLEEEPENLQKEFKENKIKMKVEKLEEHKEIALMSKKLATIEQNVPVVEDLEIREIMYIEKEFDMKEQFKKLEFKSLL